VPPGWNVKPIDVAQDQAGAAENTDDGRRHVGLGERGDGAVEDHAEALRIDRPAHDVERVGPVVLAAHFDHRRCPPARTQHAGRRAIAEQGGGDDVRLGQLSRRNASVHSSTATSNTTLPGRDCARRDAIDRPADAAGAAQAEYRHTLDVGRKPMRPATCASRLGVAMPVDEIVTTVSTCSRREMGGVERPARRVDEQLGSPVEKRCAALRPAQRFEIPLERAHRIAPQNPRSLEHPCETFELAETRAETPVRGGGGIALIDAIGRHGGRDGHQLDGTRQTMLAKKRVKASGERKTKWGWHTWLRYASSMRMTSTGDCRLDAKPSCKFRRCHGLSIS
jgi:hypothetical protein